MRMAKKIPMTSPALATKDHKILEQEGATKEHTSILVDQGCPKVER